MKTTRGLAFRLLTGIILLFSLAALPAQQDDSSTPPDHVVRLIFIHHSTGENWLRDDYGELGLTLSRNNYFVSDTNYGWGPDAVGDRTDIPNWTEWFASEATPRIMEGVFNESGQNSSYTRTVPDPGGVNEIIMFKSCFPNSALEGNPNDPPGEHEEMTVSGAKYVYNTILQYFATRPDKLFIVITAPPLSDSEYAENARAFNNWLVNDWLVENNYPLGNVAVFDFYNILTGPDAHHRFANGQVEHIQGSRNTLYYPSEDDHPSAQGSHKATDEFIPMLNVYYQRWHKAGPLAPPASLPTVDAPAGTAPLPVNPPPAKMTGLLDDFEGTAPAGTAGWEGFFQDNTDTHLSCAPESGGAHAGTASLKFEFDAAPNSWATCGFYYDNVQNWSAGQGISFYLRTDHGGIPFDVDIYGGDPGGRITYVFHTQTPAGSENNWTLVEIAWADIRRAEWEDQPGIPINPAEITGFSIGLSSPETERLGGTIWLDDLALSGIAIPPAQPRGAEPTPVPNARRPLFPCGSAMILPLALAGCLRGRRKL